MIGLLKNYTVSKKTVADIKKSLPSLNLQLALKKSEIQGLRLDLEGDK